MAAFDEHTLPRRSQADHALVVLVRACSGAVLGRLRSSRWRGWCWRRRRRRWRRRRGCVARLLAGHLIERSVQQLALAIPIPQRGLEGSVNCRRGAATIGWHGQRDVRVGCRILRPYEPLHDVDGAALDGDAQDTLRWPAEGERLGAGQGAVLLLAQPAQGCEGVGCRSQVHWEQGRRGGGEPCGA